MSVASNKQYNLHFKKWKKKVNVLSEVFFTSWGKLRLKYSYFPFSDVIFFIFDEAGVKKQTENQMSSLVVYKEQQKEVQKFQ